MRAQYVASRHRQEQEEAQQNAEQLAQGQGTLSRLQQRLSGLGINTWGDQEDQPLPVETDRIAHDADAPEQATEHWLETVYIWPENLPVLQAWHLVSGQWRVGFNGPATFDAAGARALLLDMQPSRKKRAKWWPLLLECAEETSIQRRVDVDRHQAQQQAERNH